jgi:hypothetical protein
MGFGILHNTSWDPEIYILALPPHFDFVSAKKALTLSTAPAHLINLPLHDSITYSSAYYMDNAKHFKQSQGNFVKIVVEYY